MSDMEEPPTKLTKMDMTASSLDSTMESQEGQEEWLSEGVLTDDDYMATNATEESTLDPNATAEVSQDMELPQEDLSQAELSQAELSQVEMTQTEMSHTEMSQTEMSLTEMSQEELSQELSQEAVTDSAQLGQNIEDTLNNLEGMEDDMKNDAFGDLLTLNKHGRDTDREHEEPRSDDDGNDTDDLLRMLGEDDSKKKKKVLTTLRERKAKRAARSSEDEYLFEGAKVTTLKVAKNSQRKQPMKAEPEDFSDRDSDMSDDDVSAMKKMFNAKSRPGAAATKSRAFASVKNDKPKPSQLKQYSSSKVNLKRHDKSLSKILYKEEFLDDDLDEHEAGDMSSMGSAPEQPIRRPERMDEEVPSDEDSHSEDDSLYDVLPSSDSEDLDDWFTLDIRAERAGDYLPWLGDKAQKLLTEEKHRVSARLEALRQSVSALRKSGRVQADQIKVATDALHELDAMLAAA